MNRRKLLAGIGGTGLLGLAGCLDVVGLAEHTSTPIGVEADAREETGYPQTGLEKVTVSENVGVLGYSEEVVVHNHSTDHEKAVDMGPLGQQRGAVFTVLSTPQISVIGRQVNPIEDKSTADLVELVADNYDSMDDVRHESDDEVSILDESTTESTFVANAEFDGADVEVNVHVTEAVETDDDLVFSIGVYPRHLESQERGNIRTLMEAISEDVDVEGDDENGENDGESDEGGDDVGL